MSATRCDEFERELWAGRAEASADTHANLCRHTIPLLLDAAGVGQGSRVLDAGCGPGNPRVAACARGARVVAVDAEPGMVELTARAAGSAETRVAVLPDLPFADGGFLSHRPGLIRQRCDGAWKGN
ncbi:MAG TPA: methyltransferase domain-containing protein [Actinocrinis sp.]|nr:methyltransferase domain-containing protein [Actinocrinis sp.]